MYNISIRLNTILNFVNKTNTIADIGTDHGIIPYFIIKKNLAKKVIATDINKNIIEKVKNKFKNELTRKESERIDFRVGNGLKTLSYNEANIIIISGMGSDLIKKILFDINKYKFDYLIISPQTKLYEFRKNIINNKLKIIDEDIIEDNKKFYFVFKIKKTFLKLSCKEYDFMFSKKLIYKKNPIYIKFLKSKIVKYQNILNKYNNINYIYKLNETLKILNIMGEKYDI